MTENENTVSREELSEEAVGRITRKSTGIWSTGDGSTGNWSTGDNSTGDRSTGNWSTGSWSTGNWSTGSRSTGNRSTGDGSTGDRSTGYKSTGYGSTGNWSKSHFSTGHFSTEDYSGYGSFDKPCTKEDWDNAYKPDWLFFELTEWVKEKNMTDSEKEDNPTFKTMGGFLRVYDYKEAFQKSYNAASRKEQLRVKDLPNFDADKFYQISGIRIDNDSCHHSECDYNYCPHCGHKIEEETE